MDQPLNILLEKNDRNENNDQYSEDNNIKNIIINLDISVFFLFIVRIINNFTIKENSIWYIATFYIIGNFIFIYYLYRKKKYIKQILVANAIFFSILIAEGFVSIYLYFDHKDIINFVFGSLSIIFGIFGCYFSKEYFNKNYNT